MTAAPLSEIVSRLRAAPAWQRKHEIELLAQPDNTPPVVDGRPVPNGDDTAAIETESGTLLLAAEVIYPPLVEADPYQAGRAAVLANVNDVYAMGGRPLALVNTILAGDIRVASEILRGLRDGCQRYGVALVGGHLTATGPVTSVSASILGRANKVLSSFNAWPGDIVLHVINLRGQFHPRFAFWDCSAHLADTELRYDLELLPMLAERGWCDCARDISMAGALGSLLMVAELSGVGAEIDLSALPVPDAARERYFDWLIAFPSYGFILCVRPQHVAAVRAQFAQHAISCAPIGTIIASPQVNVRRDHEAALLWDFTQETFMGLSPIPKSESG
ncbi:MAG: sll0787 family AIR synthase-like protein [Anaerolineales bacterium]